MDSVLDVRKTAVLAVHMQGDIVTREGALANFFAEMVETSGVIEKGRALIDAARAGGATIAYARVAFSDGYPELEINSPMLAATKELNAVIDGTVGGAIVPTIAPQDGDIVVTHHRVSPTFETSLAAELRERGIDTVIVFGVATNVSVEATARTLSDERFRVIVAADASTAATQAAHDASIETLGLLVAEICNTDDLADALRQNVAV